MSARVLLVRPGTATDADLDTLVARGFTVTHDPYLSVTTSSDPGAPARAESLLVGLSPGAWLVLASAAGARALVDLLGRERVRLVLAAASEAGSRFAAVGPTSAAALEALGARDVRTPTEVQTASGLLARLAKERPSRALIPRSAIADRVIPMTLEARGWVVHAETLYETTAVAERPPTADDLAGGAFDAVVLRSPSAARAVHRFAPALPPSVAVIAGGPTTAMAAARLGLAVRAVSSDSTAAAIATAVDIALRRAS